MGDLLNHTMGPGVRAALFDIDGTLTSGGEVWGPLVKSPGVSRFRRAWLYMTFMPHYLLFKAGIASQAGFRDRWVRLVAWLMKGWSGEQVEEVCATIVHEVLVPSLRSDMVAVLDQHKTAGHPVILISSMFEPMVSGLAQHLKADAGLGSRLDVRQGVCRGKVIGPTCSGERKIEFAQSYLGERYPDILLNMCAAYADSQSDIPLLAGAGYPVAVYPDEVMRAAAQQNGWLVYEGPAA